MKRQVDYWPPENSVTP